MTNLEHLKSALASARKHERHRNNAETRYWLDQYKMIAHEAVAEARKPAREWVGLTDEDVMELFANLVVLKQDYKDPVDAFKAICLASDAKLREKNT